MAVIDTNVALDWLVFNDPIGRRLQVALESGRLRWLATEAMRDEMAHVLARGLDPRWEADEARWRQAWERWSLLSVPPVVGLTTPRCRDPDDQKFIDLAVAHRARWLLTRDRAVLKLARRLATFGVDVVTPDRCAALDV